MKLGAAAAAEEEEEEDDQQHYRFAKLTFSFLFLSALLAYLLHVFIFYNCERVSIYFHPAQLPWALVHRAIIHASVSPEARG